LRRNGGNFKAVWGSFKALWRNFKALWGNFKALWQLSKELYGEPEGYRRDLGGLATEDGALRGSLGGTARSLWRGVGPQALHLERKYWQQDFRGPLVVFPPFQGAARQETLTLKLVRDVVRYLNAARVDPSLRFSTEKPS
jgi:hypothetical protein